MDDWANTVVPKGTILYGGAPGSSQFLFTAEGMVASKGSAIKLFDGLQVFPSTKYVHPITGGLRPGVTLYVFTEDTAAASARSLANPKAGIGEYEQFFIGNAGLKNVEPVLSIPLKK